MADTPERKRPNANYPLSNKKRGEEELVFYYSRADRLAKASKPVQALYEDPPQRKFRLFHSLTATRPLAMLFISIIILCAVIMMISIFGLNESGHILGGNRVSFSAVKFQGETIVILEKTSPENQEVYTGVVDIGVSPAAPPGSDPAARPAEYPVFTHRVFFSLNPEESYRFALPFEADELAVVLQGEQERDTVQVKIKVK
ncbi:MAG: hypothetical protein LBE14_00855 [Treponema sp.]|jgi:hypothetical protein|nr:hypothetical protein [Treponema sp.]